jgi:hypothetical protein
MLMGKFSHFIKPGRKRLVGSAILARLIKKPKSVCQRGLS